MGDINFDIEATDHASNVLQNVDDKLGALDKSAGDTGNSSDALSSQLSGLAVAALGPLAAATTLAGAFNLVKNAIEGDVSAAAEDQTALSQLDMTIQSTGRSGEISAGQLDKLASSPLFTPAQINEAATALARFVDIPSQDMPKDLIIMENMAVALGTDLPGAAQTFGMAMETGRTRGLGFSRELQTQITALMTAGDIQQADAIILDQLSQKYSGEASVALNTYNGEQQALAASTDELGKAIGDGLLPILEADDQEITAIIDDVTNWLNLQSSQRSYNEQLIRVEETLKDEYIQQHGLAAQAVQDSQFEAQAAYEIAAAKKTEANETAAAAKITQDTLPTNTKYVSDMKSEYDGLITTLGQMDPRTIAVGEAFGLLTDAEIQNMVNLHNFDVALQNWGNKPITKDVIINLWSVTTGGWSTGGGPSGGNPVTGQSNIPSIPSTPVTSAPGHFEGGVWVPGYASGADFVVPPGYPSDSYPMRVQSGEHVTVTPAGQSSPSAQHVHNYYITAPGPDATARAITLETTKRAFTGTYEAA